MRMHRPLIPFVAAYIYGIVAAELFRYLPLTVFIVSILLFTPVILLSRYSCIQPHILPSIVALSAAIGFSWMLYVSAVPSDDIFHYATGERMTVTGMVDEPARFYPVKVAVRVRVMKILKGDEEIPVSGRIKLSVYDPEVVLSYGDIIRFTGRVKKIRGFKNPGLFDYSRYVARQGIRASVGVGKKDDIAKMGTGGIRVLRKIYGWREDIRLSITRGLSGPSSSILQAMIVGATGDLTSDVRDKFMAAGVTHILSISGSHLGFVALLVFFIVRHTFIQLPHRMLVRMSLYMIPSKIAALVTFFPVIFYTFLSGGEIATVRSLIMALVYLTAILIEREDDAINTLAIAALLALLWDPQALFDISFQLSYMAVLSMILVVKRFYNKAEDAGEPAWRERYWKRLKLLILLTLGASLSTDPIVTHYFNQITWVGILSNMIVVPFVGFTVVPVGLFTGCLALILHADVLPLAWLNNLLLVLLYKMVELFAGFPLSVIHTPSPDLPVIFFIYGVFISLLYFKYLWAKIFLPVSISILVLSLGCTTMFRYEIDTMRVTFLDVGQGDSALVEFQNGEVMVIDGGGTFSKTFDIGRSIVGPYLWNSGIRRIDYVVSTHPQLDHVEGLTYLVNKFKVGEVWTNGRRGRAAQDFDRAVRVNGIKRLTIQRDKKDIVTGGCTIQFLNPPGDTVHHGYSWKSNDLSIAIRLVCRDISYLFTGDIEAKAMREIMASSSELESTVIKVPHHGAKGSVDYGFIAAVNPAISVISAGFQNSYRHPSSDAISAYSKSGAPVYRTDLDGAVIIETGDGGIKIRTYEDMTLREAGFDSLSSAFKTEWSNIQKIREGL